MSEDFVTWIQREMDAHGWSQSELARRGGFTPTAINKILNRERMPGVEFCKGVARAFGMRDIEVMRIAGLADPEPPSDTPTLREMIGKFTRLSDEDQIYILKIVTALDETEQAQKRRAGKPVAKGAKT
jgi:transcriptional regulator with XRE-family HTH domain